MEHPFGRPPHEIWSLDVLAIGCKELPASQEASCPFLASQPRLEWAARRLMEAHVANPFASLLRADGLGEVPPEEEATVATKGGAHAARGNACSAVFTSP